MILGELRTSTKNDDMVTWSHTGGNRPYHTGFHLSDERDFQNALDDDPLSYWHAFKETCPNCEADTITATFKEQSYILIESSVQIFGNQKIQKIQKICETVQRKLSD